MSNIKQLIKRILLCATLVMAFAVATTAQVSLTLKNKTVREAIREIEKKTEYRFFIDDDLPGLNIKITLNIKNRDIKTVMDLISQKGEFSYRLRSNNQIVILPRTDQKQPSQKRTINGKITDPNGEPVIGANVVIKGTNIGTTTDIDGHFTLDAAQGQTLVVSYIGYSPKEIAITTQSAYNISIAEDMQKLEEVVVIGYGKLSRSMVTTSITKLDNKVLENVPYASAASALQGSVSGVRVQSTTGQPGAAPRVIVRGGTSINNPNGAAPLYIIDGVIRPQMADISPDDIESMQVLKDAASTSIYGSRASNGVVLITTKSGKKGKMKVNYRYDLSISDIGKRYQLASAKDYITLMRKGMIQPSKFADITSRLTMPIGYGTGNDLSNKTAFTTQYLTEKNKHKLNDGWQSMPDPLDPTKTLIFDEHNFQDLTYKTAYSHNHHAEISGGTDKATFNAGLGYLTNDGTVINTNYSRFTFNLNGTLQALDNLVVSANANYSNSENYGTVFGANAMFYRSPGLPPTAKLYFEDGSLAPGASINMGNPLYTFNNIKRDNSNNNLTLSLKADWEIFKGFSFNPQISMFDVNNRSSTFQPSYWDGPLNYVTTRNASASTYNWRQYQADAVFNYIKDFGTDHSLSATAGYTYFGRTEYRVNASGRGASTDIIPTLNAVGQPTAVGSSVNTQMILGLFARANYSYKNKYLLSVSARRDGASNLGKNFKWGVFPGVSAAWHVDREKFWDFLPENLVKLKVRASYGVTGNISGLGDYTSQGEYGVGSRYNDNPGITLSVLENQNLQWEESKTFDVGADLGLFDDRVSVIFDWYNRITDNLITNFSLPPSTGFGSILTNYGSLRNRGIDLELSARILSPSSPVQWSMSFNASYVKNKIISLPPNGIEFNRVGGVHIWNPTINNYAWMGGLQEGGTIGDMFAYHNIGVYTTDEEAAKAPFDKIVTVVDKTKYGGDAIWKDLDGNNIIDDKDRVFTGNPYPVWTGGFSNTLSYKGLMLYLRLDYTTGHTIYNYAKAFLDNNWQGDLVMTQDAVDLSWKQQGDRASMSRFYWGGDRGQQNALRGSSYYYESGNFLAVREVTLAYTLPLKVSRMVWSNNIRFSVTGNNLHYFTSYKGLNPEEGGTDDGRYALPRSVIFGVNVTF